MAILTVGTGSGFGFSTLASAVAASANGDIIQVQAGTYTNDFAAINTSITIEGVGGMVNLVATTTPLQQKGILIIGGNSPGPTVTLDNISFSGAAISSASGGNGAGIRYQSGNLTIDNCNFQNNQDGLLANPDPNGSITINHSEFANNGNASPPSSGTEHNLYVGAIQQLTIDNSTFTNPITGHDIKSRALNTTIRNSIIADPNGTGSYQIDLPNGGNAIIQNNTIEKGPGAQNHSFISFGEGGSLASNSALSVTGNTVINDTGGAATLLANHTGVTASVTNNTVYGLTVNQLVSGPAGSLASNALQPISSAPPVSYAAPYLPVLPFSFACFAAGTRILTTNGDVPVESLGIGQHVNVTGPAASERSRPVRWIGHRTIDLTRHAHPDHVQPIRIRAGAFAPGRPRRDLLLSPDHAVYTDGMLIPVRLLRNDATIVREDGLRSIRYFHVELDRHDVLFAEDLAAESYLDTGNRGIFENAGMPMTLHPDMTSGAGQAKREGRSCAPFVADAGRVEPVWRRLAGRAAELGYRCAAPVTTTDPALRLLAGRRTCRPVAVDGARHVFVLPPETGSVRILSRSAAPCELAPWVEDRRRLGVAVGRIVLGGSAGRGDVALDHPSLADGWWAAERDRHRLWRWTNGDAALRLPPGTATVAIDLAGENRYRSGTREATVRPTFPTGIELAAS